MLKTIFVSDTHWVSPLRESGSLFPRHLERLSADEAEQFYTNFDRACTDANNAFTSWIERESRKSPIDLIVHLGDVTSGWQEEGCAHPSVFPLASELLRRYRAVAKNTLVAWGNHDVGYSPEGLSRESLEACGTLSPLFWHFKAEDLLLIGLCMPLADYKGTDKAVLKLQKEQAAFLAATLENRKLPMWALLGHGPILPRSLDHIILPHEKFLRYFVYGDLHRTSVGQAIRAAAKIPLLDLLPEHAGLVTRLLRKSVFCPSVAPVWWEGHAFLSGSIRGTKLYMSELSLPAYPEDRRLPTASLLNALMWRFAKQTVPIKSNEKTPPVK